ncbi:unnamed protein product [Ectocarpus sp. 4 AP-2014]
MEATAAEQQREARRQKVLARSQGGHRAPVVDLATEQKEIAPRGVTADLDDDVGAVVDDHPLPAPEDAGKSASRLAAERRRQRILSRSTERMAKVQGDRVIRSGDAAEGEESLDDMLEAAEVEFFGGKEEGTKGVAEVKPAATRQQAYFKSGGGGGPSREEGGGAVGAATAQRKPSSRQRLGGAEGTGFKLAARSDGGASRQSPPSGGGGGRASSRRPTGNKALEKQGFDLAAIQSLSRAAGTDNSGVGGAATAGRKRLLGGVRFWTGLEGVTKTALLLLLGAGVGGLLLPEARAAVAQAKFEAEHMQGFADSRSRLELFLAEDGVGGGRKALDVGFDGGSTAADEFGDVVDVVDADSSSSSGSSESAENTDDSEEDAKVDDVAEGRGDEAVLAATMGEEEAGDDGLLSEATDWFLNFVDFVVGWAHYLSAVSMPWGGRVGEISCVSAIYLAIFVRLVVAVAFSGVRVVLGLPAFPAANPTSKPGMVMGMVLATVPTLGKVLAWGNVVKSIFSDTNLVVAGTVLTLALNLAFEEGAGPRRLAGSMSGALGLFSPSFQGSEEGDYSTGGGGGGGLKEL